MESLQGNELRTAAPQLLASCASQLLATCGRGLMLASTHPPNCSCPTCEQTLQPATTARAARTVQLLKEDIKGRNVILSADAMRSYGSAMITLPQLERRRDRDMLEACQLWLNIWMEGRVHFAGLAFREFVGQVQVCGNLCTMHAQPTHAYTHTRIRYSMPGRKSSPHACAHVCTACRLPWGSGRRASAACSKCGWRRC